MMHGQKNTKLIYKDIRNKIKTLHNASTFI